MPSDRVQKQIDRLFGQAEKAIGLQQWEDLRTHCELILSLDPDNSDATRYLGFANKESTTDVVSGNSDAIEEISSDETTLIDDQSSQAPELIDLTENPENFNWLRKTKPGLRKRCEEKEDRL